MRYQRHAGERHVIRIHVRTGRLDLGEPSATLAAATLGLTAHLGQTSRRAADRRRPTPSKRRRGLPPRGVPSHTRSDFGIRRRFQPTRKRGAGAGTGWGLGAPGRKGRA